MKLLTLATAAVVATGATAEDACSPEQVTALKTSAAYKTFQTTDCSWVLRTNCKENPCLKSAAAVIDIMPNCTIDGVALKQGFKTQLDRIYSSCRDDVQTPTSLDTKPEANGCTAEQVFLVDNNKYTLAWRQACKSPPGTDKFTSVHKMCEKTCQDAAAALAPTLPNCTTSGTNLRDAISDDLDDLRSSCTELAEIEATTAPPPTSRKSTTSAPVSVSVSAATSASAAVGIAIAAVTTLLRL